MKVAIILPSLVNKGPVLVAKDIICHISPTLVEFTVFYFDDKVEIDFPCKCERISVTSKIDFNSFDIIHSHMLRPDFYIWLNKKHIVSAKCISTNHQDIVENMKYSHNLFVAKIVSFLWLKLFRKFDVIVMLTREMKTKYLPNLQKNRVEVIYNGRKVETHADIPIEDSVILKNIKASFKVIGCTAVLTRRKGVHLLVEALKTMPDYALVVVGDGIELNNLITLSKKLGVSERCFFIGARPLAYRYLSYFDVMGMCSTSEGFPLSLLEAGLYNKSVVVSDIPIFRELFSDEEVVFFDLKNMISLTKAIKKAFRQQEMYGNNLNRTIHDKYSVDNMARCYYELYNEISKERNYVQK